MSLHDNPFMRREAGPCRGRLLNHRHLGLAGMLYLMNLLDTEVPFGPLFTIFRIPMATVGVNLLRTPWNDVHLQETNGMTHAELRQAHLNHGMPASLAKVLHLAGEAGVRILVFDGETPRLPGLPVCDD
jgi:hypothetical protein